MIIDNLRKKWRKIITPALPVGSACPLILRGRFRWGSHNLSPLKIRGVLPKAGRCYELIDNWQIIIDNIGEVGKSEMGIENYQLRITENHQIIESVNYTLCIIHWLLGRCPKPHMFFCLDAKRSRLHLLIRNHIVIYFERIART